MRQTWATQVTEKAWEAGIGCGASCARYVPSCSQGVYIHVRERWEDVSVPFLLMLWLDKATSSTTSIPEK